MVQNKISTDTNLLCVHFPQKNSFKTEMVNAHASAKHVLHNSNSDFISRYPFTHTVFSARLHDSMLQIISEKLLSELLYQFIHQYSITIISVGTS
jgi:hypothetical protein